MKVEAFMLLLEEKLRRGVIALHIPHVASPQKRP